MMDYPPLRKLHSSHLPNDFTRTITSSPVQSGLTMFPLRIVRGHQSTLPNLYTATMKPSPDVFTVNTNHRFDLTTIHTGNIQLGNQVSLMARFPDVTLATMVAEPSCDMADS